MILIMWAITIVGLIGAFILGVKKYILDTDTYDNTELLDRIGEVR